MGIAGLVKLSQIVAYLKTYETQSNFINVFRVANWRGVSVSGIGNSGYLNTFLDGIDTFVGTAISVQHNL